MIWGALLGASPKRQANAWRLVGEDWRLWERWPKRLDREMTWTDDI